MIIYIKEKFNLLLSLFLKALSIFGSTLIMLLIAKFSGNEVLGLFYFSLIALGILTTIFLFGNDQLLLKNLHKKKLDSLSSLITNISLICVIILIFTTLFSLFIFFSPLSVSDNCYIIIFLGFALPVNIFSSILHQYLKFKNFDITFQFVSGFFQNLLFLGFILYLIHNSFDLSLKHLLFLFLSAIFLNLLTICIKLSSSLRIKFKISIVNFSKITLSAPHFYFLSVLVPIYANVNLLFVKFFSPEDLGRFSFWFLFVSIIQIIGLTSSNFYLSKFLNLFYKKNNDMLKSLYKKSTLFVTTIACVILLVYFIFFNNISYFNDEPISSDKLFLFLLSSAAIINILTGPNLMLLSYTVHITYVIKVLILFTISHFILLLFVSNGLISLACITILSSLLFNIIISIRFKNYFNFYPFAL